MPLVRLLQSLIEAWLAHAARLAALTLREPMAAGSAPELSSGRRVTLSARRELGGFRPAPLAFLAEDFLALHAHTRHDHPRIERKNRFGLAIAAETADENRSVNVAGQTTATIRVAIAASNRVALVRGVPVLITPWRSVYFNSLALS
jgi:hypothetical protein